MATFKQNLYDMYIDKVNELSHKSEDKETIRHIALGQIIDDFDSFVSLTFNVNSKYHVKKMNTDKEYKECITSNHKELHKKFNPFKKFDNFEQFCSQMRNNKERDKYIRVTESTFTDFRNYMMECICLLYTSPSPRD